MSDLDKNEVIKVLTRNAIKCLVCNTVLESKYQHNFRSCGCHNQSFVDGGLLYTRVGAVNLDLVENLCEYVEMTRGERDKQLEKQRLDEQLKLQKRIDDGEMLNVGSESNPHWVSKEVWDIVMKVSEKYYPNPKKNEE